MALSGGRGRPSWLAGSIRAPRATIFPLRSSFLPSFVRSSSDIIRYLVSSAIATAAVATITGNTFFLPTNANPSQSVSVLRVRTPKLFCSLHQSENAALFFACRTFTAAPRFPYTCPLFFLRSLSLVSGIGIDLGEGDDDDDDDDDDDLISLETLSTHCSIWRPWRKAALLSSFLRPFCCFPRSAPNGRPVRCVITPDNGGPELNAKF